LWRADAAALGFLEEREKLMVFYERASARACMPIISDPLVELHQDLPEKGSWGYL